MKLGLLSVTAREERNLNKLLRRILRQEICSNWRLDKIGLSKGELRKCALYHILLVQTKEVVIGGHVERMEVCKMRA